MSYIRKVAKIFVVVSSIVVLFLAIIELMGVIDAQKANMFLMPLLGCNFIVNGILTYDKKLITKVNIGLGILILLLAFDIIIK